MKTLCLTLDTPEENLALDEALLDEAELHAEEESTADLEILRIWEPQSPFVVVGRSSRVDEEVHLDYCQQNEIPILRRSSGGATILTGPGCLMYAVVISLVKRPHLQMLDQAHAFVLKRLAAAIRTIPSADGRPLGTVSHCGTSDLAMHDLKFSGNSLRVKRKHFVYHGTILYNFPLEDIARCLATPPRQPDYRQGRSHDAFVRNLPASREEIVRAIRTAWDNPPKTENWPAERVVQLVAERYGQQTWNLQYPRSS